MKAFLRSEYQLLRNHFSPKEQGSLFIERFGAFSSVKSDISLLFQLLINLRMPAQIITETMGYQRSLLQNLNARRCELPDQWIKQGVVRTGEHQCIDIWRLL